MPSGVEIFSAAAKNQAEAIKALDRLHDAAHPKSVFSEPVSAGEYTVITASEVSVGLGLGFGGGSGETSGNPKSNDGEDATAAATNAGNSRGNDSGGGLGGGGGGASAARPVAAIVIGPHGVRVEPIFDISKVAIAFCTALGAIFMARRAMRKAKKRK